MRAIRRVRWFAGLPVLVLVLILAMVATASSAESLGGYGELELKNPGASTVTISGDSYLVTDKTVMRDIEGVATQLVALPVPSAGDPPGLTPIIGARFEAQEIRGQRVLLTLDVVPALN